MTRAEILGLQAGREADAVVLRAFGRIVTVNGRGLCVWSHDTNRQQIAPSVTTDRNDAALVLPDGWDAEWIEGQKEADRA